MKKRLSNLFLLGLSCVVALAVLEILVRSFLPPLDHSDSFDEAPDLPHEKYGFYHIRNYHGSIERAGKQISFRTNSLGLRNPEIGESDGTYDILAVGDSFTLGYGVDEAESWPRRLEHALSVKYPSQKIRVINAGISGYSLSQIRLLTEDLIQAIHPKIVVLGLLTTGFNRLQNPFIVYKGRVVSKDALPNLTPVDDGFIYTQFGRIWLRKMDIWLKQYFWSGAYLLNTAARSYWSLHAPQDDLQQLDQAAYHKMEMQLSGLLNELELLVNDTRREHVDLEVLLVNSQQEDGEFKPIQSVYNSIVKKKCAELKIAYVDILPEMIRQAHGEPVFRLENNPHWSPRAYELAAQRLAEALSTNFLSTDNVSR